MEVIQYEKLVDYICRFLLLNVLLCPWYKDRRPFTLWTCLMISVQDLTSNDVTGSLAETSPYVRPRKLSWTSSHASNLGPVVKRIHMPLLSLPHSAL